MYFHKLVDFLTSILYLLISNKDNDKFGALSEAVKYHKTNEQGVGNMCKLMEDLMEDYAKQQRDESRMKGLMEGMAVGAIKGKVEIIRNMLSRGIDINEALSLAELDKKTYEEFSKVN